MRKMALFVMVLSLAAMARAQPGNEFSDGPRPPPETWEDEAPAPDSQQIGKMRRMLEAVRITRMTEELRLNDQQIATFIPKLKQLDENKRLLGHQRRDLIKQLAQLLNGRAKDAELKSKLDEIEKLQADRMQKVRENERELEGLLSLEQRARWKVFSEHFDDEIRSMVREIRQHRMSGPHR
jgi:hypothetical protein